jgi:hypothetical protein
MCISYDLQWARNTEIKDIQKAQKPQNLQNNQNGLFPNSLIKTILLFYNKLQPENPDLKEFVYV